MNLTRPWDFSAQTIYYHHSDLPIPKIHLMCLRLFYNALGGLYMCWAHFICSYISQEEFSVRLMGTIHSDWVTCRDKWAHAWKQAEAVDNKHFKANSHFSLFISLQYTAHLLFREPSLILAHHVFSPATIDWPASWRQRMDIIFPTKWWGVRINILTVG